MYFGNLGTAKHEETSWCAFDSIFKYFNGEESYMQKVAKQESPATTEEPETTTTAEEPAATTEEPVTKNEEPATKTEEPVPKSQETTTTNEQTQDIDNRVETSGHHQSLKTTTDASPPTEEMKSGCCVIV